MKQKKQLTIRPYGGLGEIGSNMVTISNEKGTIIIDAGILFPNEDVFDINYLIPDYSEIDKSKEVHIVITHGHEDHIGAIHHVIKDFPDADIYCPKFAYSLIKKKLHRRNISKELELYRDGMHFDLLGLTISPVQVNHSIPDTFGVLITTPLDDKILYISDFKVDSDVKYEPPFKTVNFQELMEDSRSRICLFDSTNILKTDKTTSETELVHDLGNLIKQKRRKFITMFSSNVHRVKAILNLAIQHKQRVVPIGRSIRHYIEAAEECNILNAQEMKVILQEDQVQDNNADNLVMLLTGCQGDYRGALRRVSSGEHKKFKLNSNDLVIFSSKVIPGNEKIVYKIYNQITETGAEVVTARDYTIHASGHAGQDDLHQMIQATDPTHYIPIHGESYFLKKHQEFINEHYPKVKTNLIYNFSSIHLMEDGNLEQEIYEGAEPKLIHGNDLEIERSRISERRKIANSGLISIACSLSKGQVSIEFVGLPEILSTKYEEFETFIKTFVNSNKKANKEQFKEELRIKTRNYFKEMLGYRPIAHIHVL
jgi:ribonuclease J